MFTTTLKINKCFKLFKEDLFELESLLKEHFPPSDRPEDLTITVTFKDRVYTKNSMEELFNEKLLQSNDRIKIRMIGWNETGKINGVVEIILRGILREIDIQGENEVWVKGLKEVLNRFFVERKTFYSSFKLLLPALLGIGLGTGSTGFFTQYKSGNYLATFLMLFLAIAFIYFIYLNLFNKILPYVKICYYSKTIKKVDIQGINSIIATIVAVLSFIASIVFGVLTLK